MKIFGFNMVKNIKYEQGKRLLEDYIKKTEDDIVWLNEMCDRYNSTVFDLPEFAGFDYYKAVEFIRTWEIINELPADKKNLFLIFCACEYDYKRTLEIFNNVGKTCKNIATLRVMISNVRKIIRKNYSDKYGTN